MQLLKLENENLKLRLQLQNSNNTIITNNDNRSVHQEVHQEITINNPIVLINPFGKENVSYLLPEFVHQCILMGYLGDLKVFESIHFDPEHPENHNIIIHDISRNKFSVVKHHNKGDPVWRNATKEEIVDAHLKNTFELYKANMASRGVKKVERSEIDRLNYEVGAPHGKYKDNISNGMIAIIKKKGSITNMIIK